MMRSLLLHATQEAPQDKRKNLPLHCATPARQYFDSSGDESSLRGRSTDGYTSGAIYSDEDPYQLGSISATDVVSDADPISRWKHPTAKRSIRVGLKLLFPRLEVDVVVQTTNLCPLSGDQENWTTQYLVLPERGEDY